VFPKKPNEVVEGRKTVPRAAPDWFRSAIYDLRPTTSTMRHRRRLIHPSIPNKIKKEYTHKSIRIEPNPKKHETKIRKQTMTMTMDDDELPGSKGQPT